MERITCERKSCNQLLTAEDGRCDLCGRKQTTKWWVIIQLTVLYPVIALFFGFVAFLVYGLVLTSFLVDLGPLPVIFFTLALYGYFMLTTIQRYRQRQERIRTSDLETLPELE